jgi:phenylalanyl-tRNA synthetase beta chain
MDKALKQKLVHQGFTEVITYSFVSKKLIHAAGLKLEEMAKINNPLSPDQAFMRGKLWPSLLEVAVKNQDNTDSLKIFEVANAYLDKGCREELHLAAIAKVGTLENSFYELKGMLNSILEEFNLESLELVPAEVTMSEKGQGAKIKVGKKNVGEIGILNHTIANQFGHKTGLAIIEINLAALLPNFGRVITYKSLPKYPRSKRDINIVVPNGLPVAEIERTISTVNDKYLQGYRVVDVYYGKPARPKQGEGGGLSEDKKSVTINLEIGSGDRTLTDEEIIGSVGLVVKALIKLGGELRG